MLATIWVFLQQRESWAIRCSHLEREMSFFARKRTEPLNATTWRETERGRNFWFLNKPPQSFMSLSKINQQLYILVKSTKPNGQTMQVVQIRTIPHGCHKTKRQNTRVWNLKRYISLSVSTRLIKYKKF